MIPLQNLNQQHVGFLLHAGLPDDFASTLGQWEGDCVFMALPNQTALFDDPAYCVLAEHKDAGEHRIAITNDCSTIFLVATAPSGAQLFVRLPDSTLGTWGKLNDTAETQMGHAVRVSNRDTY